MELLELFMTLTEEEQEEVLEYLRTEKTPN